MPKFQHPSFTKVYHHKPYPAIDPNRPELSAEGRVVFVTGAGTGIGRAAAIAFAEAGASAIILVSRTDSTLEETASIIRSLNLKSKVVSYALDITSEENVQAVFSKVLNEFHHIDILINGAGHLPESGNVSQTPLSNFWPSFEVNVKGAFLLQNAFLNQPNSKDRERVLIYMNSFAAHYDAKIPIGTPAAYSISKLAQAKLAEYVAAENASDPYFRAYALQPGVVHSDMNRRSMAMAPPGTPEMVNYDDPALCGRFFVWLASPKGACIPSGRFLWVNWDVEELETRKDEIAKDPMALTQTLNGWPFAQPEEEITWDP